MNKLKVLLASLLFVGGFVLLAPSANVSAVNVFDRSCQSGSSTALCADRTDSAQTMVQPIVSTLLMVVGVVAVIIIIVGGILYITSTGDPGKTKRAKDTILYAVVGLAIAIMSYGIVTFVVDRVAPAESSSEG